MTLLPKMWTRSLPILAIVMMFGFYPGSAVAKLPRGAMLPSVEWLMGAWVIEGGKCSDAAEVFLPNGKMGSAAPNGTITMSGSYSLRGNMLTKIVPSGRYGDLTDIQRIGRMGANDLAADYPNNTNPDIIVSPSRRCPVQPGREPWFPKIKFKGIAAYRSVNR